MCIEIYEKLFKMWLELANQTGLTFATLINTYLH